MNSVFSPCFRARWVVDSTGWRKRFSDLSWDVVLLTLSTPFHLHNLNKIVFCSSSSCIQYLYIFCLHNSCIYYLLLIIFFFRAWVCLYVFLNAGCHSPGCWPLLRPRNLARTEVCFSSGFQFFIFFVIARPSIFSSSSSNISSVDLFIQYLALFPVIN